MNIQGLHLLPNTPSLDLDLTIGKDKNAAVTKAGNTFDSFLQTFTDMYKETDMSIQEVSNIQTDLALGKTDDIVGLTMAMEKANASLNFTIQVTNRVLEAYKEIMRMQM